MMMLMMMMVIIMMNLNDYEYDNGEVDEQIVVGDDSDAQIRSAHM